MVSGLGLTDRIWFLGLKASVEFQKKDFEKARAACEEGLALAAHIPPTTIYTLEGYAGFCRVALGLAFAESASARESTTLRRSARQACRLLDSFARIMPAGQPRSFLANGIYCWRNAQASKALRYWQKSLQAARRLRMPYEEALAHDHLATHPAVATAERDEHRKSAQVLYSACGADLSLVNV